MNATTQRIALLAAAAAVALAPPASPAAGKDFTPLDMTGVVNMGWRDGVAGDGKGGWTDQGSNDMRAVEPGRKVLGGVPFELIDPAGNGGKAVLVLKSRNFPSGAKACKLPVGAKARAVYFLHAAAWNKGHMATYVVHYADGTRTAIPIRANKEIENWWTPRDGRRYRAVLHVANAECRDVGLLMFGWDNPSPGKPIRCIELRSENADGVPIVAAVTLSKKPATFAAARPAGARRPKRPASAEGRYAALLDAGKADEAAEAVLAARSGPKAPREIDALGRAVGPHGRRAAAVLDALARRGGIAADTLRAELLVRAARGDETPGWKRRGRKNAPDPMPLGELGRRGAALMGHDDPFVRALAEWALAIRLGVECEMRDNPWPEDADWFRTWAAMTPEQMLPADYCRHAAQAGWHRTGQALAAAAAEAADRARAAADYARRIAPAGKAPELDERLAKLDAAIEALAAAAKASGDLTVLRKLYLDARLAARDVTLAGPERGFEGILFATRTAAGGGNITNGHIRHTYGPAGDIHLKTGLAPSAPARPLIAGRLGPGHLRGMDLSFDAGRIVFSYIKQPDGRRTDDWAGLYEMNADGSGLRQLTDAPHNSDMEPIYLPDGNICFVSDRSNYGSQCAGALMQDKMILNLWRCGPDGGDIRPLSNNKDFDRHPHVMDDGTILFLHWEYQERHLWQTHTLWTCRPDGAMTDAIYKQHITSGPMSLREARQVPGTDRLVAIACGHHNWEQGAIMLADPQVGVNTPEGMRLLTVGCSGTEGGYGRAEPVAEGGVRERSGHYQYPYPLSEKSFLAAYSFKLPAHQSGANFALYYVDVWGNKELIHRDRRLSVTYLHPLSARRRPPVLPEVEKPGKAYATAFVTDVNKGLDGIEPGTVKYIRISQHTPWPCVRAEEKACKFNDLHYVPSGAWTKVFGVNAWSPARVIGIVPVEEDGSACFKVPVDQPVYFQALDANFLEVRRMRSNVTFQDGEYRGCIGCHETRAVAPPTLARRQALALTRPPSRPEPPSWGDRVVPGFDRHIQPILDKHCVRCHGSADAGAGESGKPKGGLDFTSRMVDGYPQSYRTMFGVKPGEPTPVSSMDAWRWWSKEPRKHFDKEFFKRIYANEQPGQLIAIADRFSGAEVTRPRQFGSAVSKLTRTLLDSPRHRKAVDMSRPEWIALVTWVDLNAPYLDTFTDKDTVKETGLARRVHVEFPDPWHRPPAGEWVWKNENTVILKED